MSSSFLSTGTYPSWNKVQGVLLCADYGQAFTVAFPRGLHVAADLGDTDVHNDCCLRLHLLGDLARHATAL